MKRQNCPLVFSWSSSSSESRNHISPMRRPFFPRTQDCLGLHLLTSRGPRASRADTVIALPLFSSSEWPWGPWFWAVIAQIRRVARHYDAACGFHVPRPALLLHFCVGCATHGALLVHFCWCGGLDAFHVASGPHFCLFVLFSMAHIFFIWFLFPANYIWILTISSCSTQWCNPLVVLRSSVKIHISRTPLFCNFVSGLF